VKNRHIKATVTISLLLTKFLKNKVKPPSAMPVAPGVGAKYIKYVTTIWNNSIEITGAVSFKPLISTMVNENDAVKNPNDDKIDSAKYLG
jgi:hypothetical protein